jgi:hypothetical protein
LVVLLALELVVSHLLALGLPADYFGSVQPIQSVQKMDLLDIARTFLQRANHLLQNLVLIATLSAPLRSCVHIYRAHFSIYKKQT